MHPPIKHIWFDFAGTLFRENEAFVQAANQRRYDTYAKLAGITDPAIAKQEFEALYAKHGSSSAAFRSLGKMSDYWQKTIEATEFAKLLVPDPEVVPTLRQLHQLLPLSLFTNFRLESGLQLMQDLGIPKALFTHIIMGDDVAERKPALDGFHLAIKKAGLPADQLLFVGDREKVDILPAKAVGMQTCLLYGTSQQADYCFDSFAELLTLCK